MVADRNRGHSPFAGQYVPVRDQFRIKATFTRTADTNIYAAGDVISPSTTQENGYATFAYVSQNIGSDSTEATASNAMLWTKFKYNGGIIRTVRVVQSARQTTLLSLQLWFFSNTALGNLYDNAAITFTDSDLISYCFGVVDMPTPYIGTPTVGAGGNVVHEHKDANVRWTGYGPTCAPGADSSSEVSGSSLHVVAIAQNAYTPVSAEQFDIICDVELT